MSRDDFWSRRRAGVEAEAAAEARAEAAAEAAAERDRLTEKSDAEVLAELGLPDPDSLVSGDDVRAFMARAVPQHLRRRALRKLWTTNPALACLDGLVDYADDYTDAAVVKPDLQTAYQVGKGMLGHVERLAHAAEASPGDAAEMPDGDAPGPEAAGADPEALGADPEAADMAAPAPGADPAAEAESEEEAPPPPRRMAFQFEEGER